MTHADLEPPTERTCELCGRRDRWDPDAASWAIEVDGDRRRVGDPFCIHEWDVTGDYSPIPE